MRNEGRGNILSMDGEFIVNECKLNSDCEKLINILCKASDAKMESLLVTGTKK